MRLRCQEACAASPSEIRVVEPREPRREHRLRGADIAAHRAPAPQAGRSDAPAPSTSGRRSAASAHRVDGAAVEQRGPQEAGRSAIRIGRRLQRERIRGQQRRAQRRACHAQRVQAGLAAQPRMRAPHRLGLDARLDRRAVRRRAAAMAPRVGARAKRIDRRAAARANFSRNGVPASSPWNSLTCHWRASSHSGSASGAASPACMLMAVGCVSRRVDAGDRRLLRRRRRERCRRPC